MISFEDFQKIDLRVGKIVKVQNIEGSERLLMLEIDIGKEVRRIVAGIAKFYKPEDLLSKEVVIVANLEPKKLMGVESQGMLLAADDNGEPVILTVDKKVPCGSKIT